MTDDQELGRLLEALLFIAERPLSTAELAELGGVPRLQAEGTLSALAEQLAEDGRGLRLQRMDEEWQLVTAPSWVAAGRLRGTAGVSTDHRRARGAGGGRLSTAVHPL